MWRSRDLKILRSGNTEREFRDMKSWRGGDLLRDVAIFRVLELSSANGFKTIS